MMPSSLQTGNAVGGGGVCAGKQSLFEGQKKQLHLKCNTLQRMSKGKTLFRQPKYVNILKGPS